MRQSLRIIAARAEHARAVARIFRAESYVHVTDEHQLKGLPIGVPVVVETSAIRRDPLARLQFAGLLDYLDAIRAQVLRFSLDLYAGDL